MRDLNDSVRSESVLSVRWGGGLARRGCWWWPVLGRVGQGRRLDLVAPAHEERGARKVPVTSARHSRRRLPIRVQATIAADDEYELYVNGQKVGAGESSRQLDEYNITEQVKAGPEHDCGQSDESARRHGGVGRARVGARARWRLGRPTRATRRGARTSIRRPPGTARASTIAIGKRPRSLGRLGETAPWDHAEEDVASDDDASMRAFSRRAGFCSPAR